MKKYQKNKIKKVKSGEIISRNEHLSKGKDAHGKFKRLKIKPGYQHNRFRSGLK